MSFAYLKIICKEPMSMKIMVLSLQRSWSLRNLNISPKTVKETKFLRDKKKTPTPD